MRLNVMVLQKAAVNVEALGDALPLIITRLCEPKEASYYMIKKYLEQHFPTLNIQNRYRKNQTSCWNVAFIKLCGLSDL